MVLDVILHICIILVEGMYEYAIWILPGRRSLLSPLPAAGANHC